MDEAECVRSGEGRVDGVDDEDGSRKDDADELGSDGRDERKTEDEDDCRKGGDRQDHRTLDISPQVKVRRGVG